MVRIVCGIVLWGLWVVLAGWLALSLLGGFVGLALIMGAPTNATQPWTWIWTQFLQCCTLPCILLLTPVFNDRDSIVRAAMVLQGGLACGFVGLTVYLFLSTLEVFRQFFKNSE